MSWLWGSGNNDPSKDDPTKNLDPSLKEFLNKESHSKPTSTPSTTASAPPSTDGAPNEYRSKIGLNPPAQPSTNSDKPAVPAESLYQDGRYADIWKTYKPLSEIESTMKTDQERMFDVVDAYNDRRAQIGRAAVENCVFEQLAQQDCFKRGGWHARMTMCRTESRAFARCYTMQARFLKALGYLAINRTPEEEERIQMHSDKLYQEMLARERAAEEAKKEGKPEPKFGPLLDGRTAAKAMGLQVEEVGTGAVTDEMKALEIFTPERRAQILNGLKNKDEQERSLEIQVLVAQAKSSMEYAQHIHEYYDKERIARQERKEKGKTTVGDTIKSMTGWDK